MTLFQMLFILLVFAVHSSIQMFGGRDARDLQFPSHLGIKVYEFNIMKRYCGAGIIYPTYLLTAKNCIKTNQPNPKYEIFAGLITEQPTIIKSNEIIKNIIMHDNVNIALIQLIKPYGPIYTYRPVALPRKSDLDLELESMVGDTFTMCGYGSDARSKDHSTTLKFNDMRVYEASACNEGITYRLCASPGTVYAPDLTIGPRLGDFGGLLLKYDNITKGRRAYAMFEAIIRPADRKNRFPAFVFLPKFSQWLQSKTHHQPEP